MQLIQDAHTHTCCGPTRRSGAPNREPLLRFDLCVQAEEVAYIKFPLARTHTHKHTSTLPLADQSYALFIMGDHVTLLSHAHSGNRSNNNKCVAHGRRCCFSPARCVSALCDIAKSRVLELWVHSGHGRTVVVSNARLHAVLFLA